MTAKGKLELSVYYEDTDSGDIVYYANYLKFMERSRAELLKEIGYSQATLKSDYHVGLIVFNVNIRYYKPARFEDKLIVVSTVDSITTTSIAWNHKIFRNRERTPITEGVCKTACVNSEFKPTRLPSDLSKRLTFYQPQKSIQR